MGFGFLVLCGFLGFLIVIFLDLLEYGTVFLRVPCESGVYVYAGI